MEKYNAVLPTLPAENCSQKVRKKFEFGKFIYILKNVFQKCSSGHVEYNFDNPAEKLCDIWVFQKNCWKFRIDNFGKYRNLSTDKSLGLAKSFRVSLYYLKQLKFLKNCLPFCPSSFGLWKWSQGFSHQFYYLTFELQGTKKSQCRCGSCSSWDLRGSLEGYLSSEAVF